MSGYPHLHPQQQPQQYYPPSQQQYYPPPPTAPVPPSSQQQQYYPPPPTPTPASVYDYEGHGYTDQQQQQYGDPTYRSDFTGIYTCDSRFMAMTVNAIPKSNAIRLQTKIPIALLVQPLATVEYEPRSINFGAYGVIRCRSCRAYINPFVELKESQGAWICNVCGRQNDLPSQYLQEIRNPETRENHPELTEASFEIVAPSEYTVRAPQPPTFIFVIDVSHRAVLSGMVSAVCQSIAASLDELPGKPRTNVGFITFDSTVHLHLLKGSNKNPQVLILPDLDDMHLPVPSDLLVNLDECRLLVDNLLQAIPSMYQLNQNPERAFGPALNVAIQLGHSIGGKIISCLAGIPNQGEGSLQNRDNPRLYGTDKEHTLLQAANKYYRAKAENCVQYHLMFDLLLFPDQYTDIATLGELAQYSGGQLCYYPGFNFDRDTERVSYDLYHILTRQQSWEAVFRVRSSRGLKIQEYYGNYFKRSPDLLSVPNFDADKAYIVEFANEEAAIPTSNVTIQAALLYSNSNGERRLRIHTIVVPVAQDAPELYNALNPSVIANLAAKKAIASINKSSVQTSREIIQFQCTELIGAYKKCFNYALSSLQEYPATLYTLPIFTLGLLKHIAFKDGADVSVEVRAATHLDINSMGLVEFENFVQPKMYRIDSLQGNEGMFDEYGMVNLPVELPLSSLQLSSDAIYLINNGRTFYFRLGKSSDSRVLLEFFGISSLEGVLLDQLHLRYPDNTEGQSLLNRVWNILNYFRSISSIYHDIRIVREGDPGELRLYDLLIYDRTSSVMSLDEFVQFLSTS